MKIFHSFTLFFLLFSSAAAQDTLKIMSWNLLNYQAADTRDQYYRTVIRHVKPDALIVREITSQAAVDSFYNQVVDSVMPHQYSKAEAGGI